MQAVVVYGPGDYRLESKPIPVPGTNELVMRVESVGICASDYKCFTGAPKYWGDDSRPPLVQRGITPGHEFVGVVVEAGPGGLAHHGVQEGQRITAEQIVPRGDDRYIRRGQYWMAEDTTIFGLRVFDGAMAEYMLIPAEARVHRVSSSVKPEHAAFAEPLSCALHGIERADIHFEDTVVVAGCGPIGLGMIVGARAKSPKSVIALDLSEKKLELARLCGADTTFNPRDVDVVQAIRDLTDGYGADVYMEATGHPSAVVQGLELLRKLGTFVEFSVFSAPVTVDWSIIGDDKELDIRGAHLGPYCWPSAIRLIEDAVLPLDRICSHQFPLEKFDEAIAMVGALDSPSVKVSLLFE
ncbi:zinc-binding dehydrogenase [Mycolicibacterium komossense]|uniref:Zinc-binding dehydrogenase n=1 Tax=Mycolicibacterium komossense TaxID=1779 RepID=A0ABT3C6Q9_9MYCO|nr:zinc-binding dehydrogenase [Mycolicibacterium komossense]MCV7225143.1 zinc-binding dehydrogenase [Mycolicibacterium komossense]